MKSERAGKKILKTTKKLEINTCCTKTFNKPQKFRT